MSILLYASISTIVTMLLVHLALFSRNRAFESLQFAELPAMIDLGDATINERQPDESLDWAFSILSEFAKFDANLSPFEPGALTWEPIIISGCLDQAVSHSTYLMEPFILELEAQATSQQVPCSETEKPHRLVEVYPLPPPLEYSFDRSTTEEHESLEEIDELDELSTDFGREGRSDMSHSHFLTSNTENILDDLDDVPTLNFELAEMAIDYRFEEHGLLSSIDDNSDDDPEDSDHSVNEEYDLLSSVDDNSEGSVYSDYEPENSVHSNFEESVEYDAILPEGPILSSDLQALDTPSSSPRSIASSIIKAHACATILMHRTPFDLEIPVLAPPEPVSPSQEAFLNASEKFATKLSSDNHDLDSGNSAPDDDFFEEVTVIIHESDSEDCQVLSQPDQCESGHPAVIPPSISFAPIFAERMEEIRFNKPNPLLDCYLIRARIPNYVPPNCEARIQKIYDTLAPLPEQCKPADGSHKSSKLLVHQSQDAIRNYTEYMEQCVIQLSAVKREMKKLEALETPFMPEHRKIGKEIIQSIDSGIKDISREYFFSHRDLVSDVDIISQRRHIPTRFLARVASKSWRGVANDVAVNVEIFLENHEKNVLRLLCKVSQLMRDSENYAHNLALERLLFFRRHSKRFDELERARLSGSLPQV